MPVLPLMLVSGFAPPLAALLVSAFAAHSPLMGSKRFFLTGYRLPWLFALRRLLITGVESANRDRRI